MIFDIKEKSIILTHSLAYNVFLAIATNIPVLLITGFVVQIEFSYKHLLWKKYNVIIQIDSILIQFSSVTVLMLQNVSIIQ